MQIIGLKRVLFLTPSSAAQGCANAAMAGRFLLLLGACAEGRRDFLSNFTGTAVVFSSNSVFSVLVSEN
jgi:hypothetical protein